MEHLYSLKRAIQHLYPEFSGGLHLDRYARVLAVADAPDTGSSSERFRPRYAVDIEILTPAFEPDPQFPRYDAVPLPISAGMGGERGVFAFPEPGTLLVVGFAYGRQDHPIIRLVYPMGDNLPSVKPDELLMQQNAAVYQQADMAGNWHRITDADIDDKSVNRFVEAMRSLHELGDEQKNISEHSKINVGGNRDIDVGGNFTMLSGRRADLGTLGELNLTAGGDSTHSTAKNADESVGGDHVSRVAGDRNISIKGQRREKLEKSQETEIGEDRKEKIAGEQNIEIGKDHNSKVGGSLSSQVQQDAAYTVGGKHDLLVQMGSNETVGQNKQSMITGTLLEQVGISRCLKVGGADISTAGGVRSINAQSIMLTSYSTITCLGAGGVSLFAELIKALTEIKAALDVLSGHTHPNVGMINEGGTVAGHSQRLGGHRDNMQGITT